MKTLNDIDIVNKRVIIRCDFNVPIKDGVIIDDTRIVKSLKTISYALERASKVIILSHLGRIKTLEDKKNNSLKCVCDYLSKLLNMNVAFYNYEDDYKNYEKSKIIMFENTRFFDLDNNKESNNDEELAKYFSSFGDVYINDAFSVSHRENASNVGISKFLESVNGFLVMEEIEKLNDLLNPKRPYVVIVGGAKISDKITLIEKLLEKVDKMLIGGGMVYTFLKAKGINIGKSIYEEEKIDLCKELLNKYKEKIVLIEDNYIENKELKSIYEMNDLDIGLDIGDNTIKKFCDELKDAKTVFFNGTLGLCEDGFDHGTKEIFKYLNNLDSKVIIGGGDTVSALNKLLDNNRFVVSTGGGSTLMFLEGKKLPGIME